MITTANCPTSDTTNQTLPGVAYITVTPYDHVEAWGHGNCHAGDVIEVDADGITVKPDDAAVPTFRAPWHDVYRLHNFAVSLSKPQPLKSEGVIQVAVGDRVEVAPRTPDTHHNFGRVVEVGQYGLFAAMEDDGEVVGVTWQNVTQIPRQRATVYNVKAI